MFQLVLGVVCILSTSEIQQTSKAPIINELQTQIIDRLDNFLNFVKSIEKIAEKIEQENLSAPNRWTVDGIFIKDASGKVVGFWGVDGGSNRLVR